MSLHVPPPPIRIDPPRAQPPRAFRAIRFLAVLVLIGVVLTTIALTALLFKNSEYGPLRLQGSLVRIAQDERDRVYMLTGQLHTTRIIWRRPSAYRFRTKLYVDLWSFDANDASPLWRRRLLAEPEGPMDGCELFGADGDTLWVFIRGQLQAFSADTGDRMADLATIEEANPELKGHLSTDTRYYSFDSHGLRLKTADGREWRLDGSLRAKPLGSNEEEPGRASVPAYFTPYATYRFQVRGLDIPNWWLGLLTDEEARFFEDHNTIGGMEHGVRTRLWKAKSTEDTNFFGGYLKHTDFEPLPAAPEFLDAGLLCAPHSRFGHSAIWLREPDSVLVLHRERLGDEGLLRLTRVAGPEGAVVWDAPLPISILQSVLPGTRSVVLFGYEFIPDEGDRPGQGKPLERLVAIDLATGDVHVHDHTSVDSHLQPVLVK